MLDVVLPLRAPYAAASMLQFLAVHAVPGLESVRDDSYSRVLLLSGGPGLATCRFNDRAVHVRFELADERDVDRATHRLRRLLDLDADPEIIDGALGAVPALGPLVAARPGLRAPGAVDGFELTVRTIVGQQISVAGARTVLGRIVAAHGTPYRAQWRLFPEVATMARLGPEDLPMPRARGRAVIALSRAVADGQVDFAAPADQIERTLLALPGIGPWTARYVRMRYLSDPDVLLSGDLAIERTLTALALTAADVAACRPWRTYLSHHLWAHFLTDGAAVRATATELSR